MDELRENPRRTRSARTGGSRPRRRDDKSPPRTPNADRVPKDPAPKATAAKAPSPAEDWAPLTPSDKGMGLVRLTLDKGVKTTAIGQLYGLDFEIEGDGFTVRVFFDYYNRRLKVMDYDAEDYRALAERLTWLAKANEFDKIFLKATNQDWQRFLGLGFMLEGILKYYFRGQDAYVLSKFGSVPRVTSPHLVEESDLIEAIMQRPRDYQPQPMPPGYQMVLATDEHIPGLVALYRKVFETYPSPLTHPDYIQQTMRRNVIYRAILDERGDVVSAASAELNIKHSNAEMTDCATLKSQRGRGLVFHLLQEIRVDLARRDIHTAYTLARARSGAMNLVFYRLGFEYSGRLLNNCDIFGQFEDMNIWVQPLDTFAEGSA